MFFTRNVFKALLAPEEAEVIAQVCNDTIDKNGVVVYGNYYENNKGNNFTTERKPGDTHVAIAIGVSELGIFDPISDAKPAVNKPKEEDLIKLMDKNNDTLMKENQRLRGGNNGRV